MSSIRAYLSAEREEICRTRIDAGSLAARFGDQIDSS
jgi:hypothetical protein